MGFSKSFIMAGAFAVCAGTAMAGTLDFDFSFTNETPNGNFAGTVTGQITGLMDDLAGQNAFGVVLTSTGGLPGVPDSGTDLTAWTEYSAFADVAGGAITRISIIALDRPASAPSEVEDFFCLNFGVGTICGANQSFGANMLSLDLFSTTAEASVIASTSVTLTRADAPPTVPLPASLGFLALGLAGLGLASRRRSV